MNIPNALQSVVFQKNPCMRLKSDNRYSQFLSSRTARGCRRAVVLGRPDNEIAIRGRAGSAAFDHDIQRAVERGRIMKDRSLC